MSTAESFNLISVDEYLLGEQESEVRHEYLGGVVYAMTGGTNAHAEIAINCMTSLHGQLTGKPCKVYGSDTTIRMNAAGNPRFYYPDVSVTCEPNAGSDTFQDNPILIIEVLSESTRRLDDGEKRDGYFTLPSLQYYLLLEQHSQGATFYLRNGEQWNRSICTDPDTEFYFELIDARLNFKTAYAGIEF